MTSARQITTDTPQNTSIITRTIIYTLLAVLLAIIALFIPSLLRGQALRPQVINAAGRHIPQLRPATTHTMSDVKLSPREVKEWNSYVTSEYEGRVLMTDWQMGWIVIIPISDTSSTGSMM